jgi:hypothetical protein
LFVTDKQFGLFFLNRHNVRLFVIQIFLF